MKVILFMAISLNGKIARLNYNEDFLSNKNWSQLIKYANESGCFIWGRRTYELVKDWDEKYFRPLEDTFKIVLTSKKNYKTERGFVAVNSPHKALKLLQNRGFKSVILTGGSTNNTSFAKLGLINEVVLDVESVVVGQGIPLFFPDEFDLQLKLLKITKISNRIIQLRYKVIK